MKAGAVTLTLTKASTGKDHKVAAPASAAAPKAATPAAAAPAAPAAKPLVPMKAPPQPVLNLAARAAHASQSDADKKALEIKAAKARKNAFFDALRRANKPTAVLLSPRMRRLLERALGLGDDAAAAAAGGGGGGAEGASGDGDSDGGGDGGLSSLLLRAAESLGVVPALAAAVPVPTQATSLRAATATLTAQGFTPGAVAGAVRALGTSAQQEALLDGVSRRAGDGAESSGIYRGCPCSSVRSLTHSFIHPFSPPSPLHPPYQRHQ